MQADNPTLKFLREPQFSALETYWFVRLKFDTPHIMDLYKHCYGDDKEALFDAVGVSLSRDALNYAEVEKERARLGELRSKQVKLKRQLEKLAPGKAEEQEQIHSLPKSPALGSRSGFFREKFR